MTLEHMHSQNSGLLCCSFIYFHHMFLIIQQEAGYSTQMQFFIFSSQPYIYSVIWLEKKRIYVKILTELHIFSPLNYENVVFGMPSVCVYGWMWAMRVLEWLDRFYS
jgi:hypothetical protein